MFLLKIKVFVLQMDCEFLQFAIAICVIKPSCTIVTVCAHTYKDQGSHQPEEPVEPGVFKEKR